jgi:hypothetical protein
MRPPAGHSPICPNRGAFFPSKKISLFPQNLENKGMGIFLPPRSMVLKVVTGKILGTLKLRVLPASAVSVLELGGGFAFGIGRCELGLGRLSKI